MSLSQALAEAPAGRPVPCLEIDDWRETYGVIAGITTREQGFDLGLFGPGRGPVVGANWKRFEAALRPGFARVRLGRQVHGTTIRDHSPGDPGLEVSDGVDGHLTSSAGTLLAVSVADCVPVYLVHPPSGAIGLLHAGWRGIAAGILEVGLAGLIEPSSGHASDIVMHCGVSICGSCYEVGPEVIHQLLGRPAETRATVDLRAILAERAGHIGVRNVTVSPWCSAHDHNQFFSHRASAGIDGRMLAYIGRPAP